MTSEPGTDARRNSRMDATLRLLAALVLAAGACFAATASRAAPGDVRIVVGFEAGAGAHARAAALARAGAGRARTLPDGRTAVLTVPAAGASGALAALRRSGVVAYAERARQLSLEQTPTDPAFGVIDGWAYTRPGFPAAWDVTTGSSAVTVAVVDTGVNPVADLGGALVPGHNFVAGNDDATDDNGHGTEVAGTIAARGDNGIGVAGACWSCRIMPVKVADAQGRGYDYNVAAGIEYAADHGAQIVNVSMTQGASTQVLADAVSYAQAHGVLVVAAAGNSSTTDPAYPAGYPGVLSVAASDELDARYAWSSYGAWVAVTAPGCVPTTSASGGYGAACGTSFSTPLVAGLAALLLSAKPGATAAELELAIVDSATPVADGYVAHGRIDAPAALAALGVPAPAPSSPVAAPERTTTGTAQPEPASAAAGKPRRGRDRPA